MSSTTGWPPARDFHEVSIINAVVRDKSPEELLRRTGNYWRLWVVQGPARHRRPAAAGDRPVQAQPARSSARQIDNDGAIIAANDSDVCSFARDTYAYMWPRDGALVANALSTRRLRRRTGALLPLLLPAASRPNGYLLHKYNPDGALGSSWHPWT